MSSRLQTILEATRVRVEKSRAEVPRADLESMTTDRDEPRDLVAALRRPGRGTADASPLRVLGEIKRRSPSAGTIYDTMDAPAVASALTGAGCAALSVLTEPEFFGGSLETLDEVRRVTSLPLLRKDFILGTYQVVEARAHGADAILLLAAALSDDELRVCRDEARRWGLSVLAEAHGDDELDRLLNLEFPIVGLNARDLRTFEVDLDRALAWVDRVPDDRVVVAESGVRTRDDADRVAASSVDAVLIGEGLMRDADPARSFALLFGD